MEPNIAYNARTAQIKNFVPAIYDEPAYNCKDDVDTTAKLPRTKKCIALLSLLSILALVLALAAVGLSVATQTQQQSEGQSRTAGDSEVQGPPGPQGEKGMKGDPGVQGPPGSAAVAGVTYIRWGRTTCPDPSGTELVYSGRVAGSHHTHSGGGAEYICLPDNPDYLTHANGVQGNSPIFGAEFETYANSDPLRPLFEHNPPCAVCYASTRAAKLMIPAKTECPASWTLEYIGYLMSERQSHTGRTMYTCVDENAEALPGEAADMDGVLFYHVEATCSTGILCPPYDTERELTCAVCTK